MITITSSNLPDRACMFNLMTNTSVLNSINKIRTQKQEKINSFYLNHRYYRELIEKLHHEKKFLLLLVMKITKWKILHKLVRVRFITNQLSMETFVMRLAVNGRPAVTIVSSFVHRSRMADVQLSSVETTSTYSPYCFFITPPSPA